MIQFRIRDVFLRSGISSDASERNARIATAPASVPVRSTARPRPQPEGPRWAGMPLPPRSALVRLTPHVP
jgi:hypothetical protein